MGNTEKKGLSLFTNYAILLFASTYIGVGCLSWFQTRYFLNAIERFLPGLKITMSITTGLAAAIVIAVFIVTRPFQKIMNKFEETGAELSEDEKKIVLNTYKKINIVSVVGIIIGFAIGNGVTVLVKYLAGSYNGTLIHVAVAMVQACIYAGFVTVFVVYMTDFFFVKYRKRLHIYDISDMKKGMSISNVVMFAVLISFLYIISNVMMVSCSTFAKGTAGQVGEYAKRIIEATIISTLPTGSIIILMLKTLNKRISTSEEQLKGVIDGTVDTFIDITNVDDFGQLTGSTNGLIKKLNKLVTDINNETRSINEVAETLEQITSEANTALTSVTDSYSKISEEGKKLREEIKSTEHDVSGLTTSVREVEGRILDVAKVAQDSSTALIEMSENINSIADMTAKADNISKNLANTCAASTSSLKKAGEAIQAIQEASNEIEEIVNTIQHISTQTNLLAMNAAIEASHAGEAGKGFAVVANEVRSLANSSSTSAGNIQDKIEDMTERVTAGVEAIKLIEDAFKKIEESVHQTAEITTSIDQALREQQKGAKTTMESTRTAAESTSEAKDLVLAQGNYTESVDSSMKTVVNSTNEMADALHLGVEATEAMQNVISRISETVNTNKQVVGTLKVLMEDV